jgi:hypothetical protein
VLNDLQAEFGKAPAAEERERQNAAQLLFLSCLHSEREREREGERAGFSCYNVTPLPGELLLHLLVYHWI